jgi:hypothetical protein
MPWNSSCPMGVVGCRRRTSVFSCQTFSVCHPRVNPTLGSDVIADISLPPFTTILLIIGTLLIVLALAGQITIKEATVGIPQRGLRWLAGVIGAGLIGLAVCLFAPALISHTPSTNASPAPAASPSIPSATIPVTRYRELAGKWSVTEKVRPEYGGYEIVWIYDAVVLGSQVTMQGKKSVVNEPSSAQEKELTPDEKGTVSVYTFVLAGLQGEGSFEEKDSHGLVTRGDLKLEFAPSLVSFTGTEGSGANVSSLMGSKQ